VFTPALSKFLGSTGNGSIDLAIQFAVFAVIVGLADVLIVRPLLKLAARPPQKLEQRDSTPRAAAPTSTR
jgi:hypothetical protein